MFKIIDHTADIGIRVSGRDLRELFQSAAEGLLAISVAVKGRAPLTFVDVELTADDTEQLMVRWLREFIVMIESGRIPVKIVLKKVVAKGLAARVGFVPISEGAHTIVRQIKAVTYHDLKIKKAGGQLTATVIFDV